MQNGLVSADRRKNATAVFRLTLCPLVARGADDPYGLRGVSSVWVLIESLGPEEANIGLADDTVRTDIELRLRSAGLRMVSPEEAKKIAVKDSAFLYVNVAVARWIGGDRSSAIRTGGLLAQKFLADRHSVYLD